MKTRLYFLIFFACILCVHGAKADESNPKVFFSHNERLDFRLIDQIAKEDHKILIAVYHFSHFQIADALIEAKERGAQIEIIVDSVSVTKKTPLDKMIRSGIDVYVFYPSKPLSKRKKIKALMHHKFCILGDEILWTGSCNFTKNGTQSNRENALLFHSSALVEAYQEEFRTLKEDCISISDYKMLKTE